MSSSEDTKEADMEIQSQIKEEDKENKKGKKKGNTRKREHKVISIANALEERKGNRNKVPKISVRMKTNDEMKIKGSRAANRDEETGRSRDRGRSPTTTTTATTAE